MSEEFASALEYVQERCKSHFTDEEIEIQTVRRFSQGKRVGGGHRTGAHISWLVLLVSLFSLCKRYCSSS